MKRKKISNTPCQCFLDINDFVYAIIDNTTLFKMSDAISIKYFKTGINTLTHTLVQHIRVPKWVNIDLDKSLSPVRHRAII